ncbi:spore coat protein [Robertmurraya kyonggiensis]|uniref:Spore coat protein n=1 Tax=Robertmurraya kyonggiensis TaxID=1037680 RepID=A0A4U1D2S5_9BACI|nr:spore coat protein [Robertmurraya kyonggiensis]TKC15376.1 spore coat protein [Robertmurraya kyonggiensis]
MLSGRTEYVQGTSRCNTCGYSSCQCGGSNVGGEYRRFNALDPVSQFPFSDNEATILQNADQVSDIEQRSNERIVIKDSCDVRVTTTDTQVAVSIQAAIQIAIALVVNITIADDEQAESITQDLLQFSQIQQVNRQTICIENSRDIEVSTTDTDVAVSIQLLLQLLIAILIQVDIL